MVETDEEANGPVAGDLPRIMRQTMKPLGITVGRAGRGPRAMTWHAVVAWVLREPAVRKLPGFEAVAQMQCPRSQLCWAAVAASIGNYFHAVTLGGPGTRRWSQCQVAKKHLGRSDCCQGGTSVEPPDCKPSEACNQPQHLSKVLQSLEHPASLCLGLVPFARCQEEIRRDTPVALRIERGNGHFIVIYGCSDDDGNSLAIWDPDRGKMDFAYDLWSRHLEQSSHYYLLPRPAAPSGGGGP